MTDAPALIDLLSGLLADLAAATADGPPRVLPIVHDALTPDRDVIEAVVERFGGVTLNAAEGSAAVVRGDPPPDLIEAVRATCERHGLLVAVDVNDATVTVRALDAGAVNDSLAAVLRLCGLLLGDAARSHALVVLIAPVQGLDDRRQRLVWDLAVRQAPRHLTGEIRVLVPVWEGSVDFDLHLAGEPSLRYAIQSGRFFARRGGEIALTAGVRSILRERDRPLVLFLGAGFSRAARLPLGDTLRDDAIAELLGVPRGSRELHETFRRWVIDRNRLMEGEREMSAQQFGAQLTLERVLREEFRRLRQEGRDNAGSAIVQRLQADCRAALDRLPPGARLSGGSPQRCPVWSS